VSAWFRATDDPLEEQERMDRYLTLTEIESLGAKLRGEDTFELKLRVGILPAVEIADAHGQCERWHKWSLPVPDHEQEDLEVDPWLAVHKHRWTRHYRVTEDAGAEAVEPHAHPAEGGNFELTFLVARDMHWWSLAFESFGSEALLERNFSAVTRAILGVRPLPMPLERERSHGYPQWLRWVRACGPGKTGRP
jgi:hypothetical protein